MAAAPPVLTILAPLALVHLRLLGQQLTRCRQRPHESPDVVAHPASRKLCAVPRAARRLPTGSPPLRPHPTSPPGVLPPVCCTPHCLAAAAPGTTAAPAHRTASAPHLPDGLGAAGANCPEHPVPMPVSPARPPPPRSALRTRPAAAVECRTGSAHAP